MFELKDLPSKETLYEFSKNYHNPDVDAVYTWLVWASATDEMISNFNAKLAIEGLNQTSFFVLLLLKRNPTGLTIGALAQGVSVTSQSMTRAINKMQISGLCTKHIDPTDGRSSIVKITYDGERLLDSVLPKHYAWVDSIMKDFSENERSLLIELMMKASKAIRNNF